MTVGKPTTKHLLQSITEFLQLAQRGGESRPQGAIGFGFASHCWKKLVPGERDF